MAWVGILAWVAWVHYILARVKKKSVGRNFGMGLRCFIIKIFLKNSQNLQENICAGVCSLIKFQAEGLKKKERFQHRCFLVNFAKFFRIAILKNDFTLLLLCFVYHFWGK